MIKEDKHVKRIFIVLLLTTIILIGFIYKLYLIQIKDTRDYSKYQIDLIEKSVNQRQQEFVLTSGRGNIYDRNLESLINQEEIRTLVIFPFGKDSNEASIIVKLAELIDIDFDNLIDQIKTVNIPKYIIKDNKPVNISEEQRIGIENMELNGIVAMPYTYYDYNNALAKHVVGYLGLAPDEIINNYKTYYDQGILSKNSLIGRSGLQMTFQEILMGTGESSIAYFVDNKGKPLYGLTTDNQINQDNYYPLSLVTTIDKSIQSIAEEILEKHSIVEGSIVVLDISNGDVLAMANSPDFNLLNVNPESSNWNNKAVQIVEPGSIFKIIVAVAALEEGVVSLEEEFYCDGTYDYKFSCHENHGTITFAEGFAKSCNTVFADVAKRLGPELIENYAEKLGVIGMVGWTGEFSKKESFKQIANEQSNRVFHVNTVREDTGSLIRTAIGQQDVRMSPLSAANLLVTILNYGDVFEPRIVEKVIYKNGMDYYRFNIHKKNNNISKETFRAIIYLMEKVVEEGTGKTLNNASWNVAGKSGTAQTNNNLNNQWFIGFGPVEDARYSIAVLVKNVSSNTLIAQKVFLDIINELANNNLNEKIN